jgi:hypothetical protein
MVRVDCCRRGKIIIDSGLIGGISPEYPDVFHGAVGMPSEPPDTGVPAESLIRQALSPVKTCTGRGSRRR